ncbi:MAG: alpha/beta-type small acid-soluble spore protein [Bacillota bacterium]
MASNSSNQSLIPEAKAKLNQFKTEVASSLGVNLKQGYNGDLTSREAGSIGGEMVKRMIAYAEQSMPNSGVGGTSGTGGSSMR